MLSQIIPVQPSESEYHVSYPGKYLFTLDEPNRCQQESPFLVIMTPVAPHNRKARDTIRSTWGSETTVLGQRVSHYFLLGLSDGTGPLQKQLLQESRRHHDILQSNFLDTYKNLTIKTMIMFEWLISHCPNSSYAMKVDSDMFLNVHNLVHMLLKAPRQLYMTGRVERKAPVSRNPKSKWYLPVSAFPESKYPPYAMGLGYVFSLDLPKRVLEASSHVRAIYIEDVYVGMCLRHLRIPLSNPPHRGLFELNVPHPESRCYWTSVITTTVRRSKQLRKVWTKYQTQIKRGCAKQRETAWENIAARVNACNPAGKKRTWLQLMMKYKNIVQTANRKKADARKTGGGRAPPPLMEAEALALRQNFGRPATEGIPGGSSSSEPTPQDTSAFITYSDGAICLVEPPHATTDLVTDEEYEETLSAAFTEGEPERPG
ncbi:beta-1,3-galactosyltransferase 2-like [Notolabrus celidotus]|uniref:beta-1,3-galactosyltransferase 2-like n=1 Tax=Notolabrus celidotus TaxID=1203425 RepID=UPI00148F9C5A|nr:beta-1,3-galactosyltransferase 2-like [Notolabrus celidotus]